VNLAAARDNLIGQVRSNRRLGWMLAAIAVVLIALLLDGALSVLQRQSNELSALQERRARLEILSGSTEWFDRAETTREALASLQAGIPATESPGLAQAIFQGWLRERTAGMDGNVFSEVGTPQRLEDVSGAEGMVRVTATVTGRSHRNTVIDLMRRAEAAPNLITIDAFSIPADAESGFSLTMSAYFRIEVDGEGNSA